MRIRLVASIALLLEAMSVEPAEAGTIDRLHHRLRELPYRSAPYPLVRHLVLTLGGLAPANIVQTYELGLRGLLVDDASDMATTTLARRLYKVIGRSDLSDAKKKKLSSQIAALNAVFVWDDPGHVMHSRKYYTNPADGHQIPSAL